MLVPKQLRGVRLVSIALSFGCANSACAASYALVDIKPHVSSSFADVSSIRKYAGLSNIWLTKVYFKPQSGDDGKPYDYIMSRMEFNCGPQLTRFSHFFFYNKAGTVIYTSDNATPWSAIVPESVGDNVAAYVCGGKILDESSAITGSSSQLLIGVRRSEAAISKAGAHR